MYVDVKVQGVTHAHAQKELLQPGDPAGQLGKRGSWGMPRTLRCPVRKFGRLSIDINSLIGKELNQLFP